jgi:hypothetical protein
MCDVEFKIKEIILIFLSFNNALYWSTITDIINKKKLIFFFFLYWVFTVSQKFACYIH